MEQIETNQRLDRILKGVRNPHEIANSINACRSDRPPSENNEWRWRTAYAIILDRIVHVSQDDLEWLEKQAHEELNQDMRPFYRRMVLTGP